MIWAWLVGVALGGEGMPISAAALEEVEAWSVQGRQLLDGPPTCVELRGEATIRVVVFRPGGLWGPGSRRELLSQGPFSGTLDHGVWTQLESELTSEGGRDELDVDSVYPMMGRHDSGEDGAEEEVHGSVSVGLSGRGTTVAVQSSRVQALSMIDALLHEIDPSVTTSDVVWDEARREVVLSEQIPLGDGAETLSMQTYFPEAGAPTALDLVFPKRLTRWDGPLRYQILNAQIHLRGQPTELGVLPALDSASLVLGVLGQTLGVEQRLVYTGARPCR